MISRFRFSVTAGAVALGLGLFAAAPQSRATEDPGAFVGSLGTKAIQMLEPSIPSEQRVIGFRRLFQDDFDVSGIGRFALGRYWRSATLQEQQEFLALFRDFTVQVCSTRLGEYGGAGFRVTGSRADGDETVVTSEVRRAGGGAIRIDWHLVNRAGQYKVTDLNLGGLSMKVAERNQFASWIQQNDGRVDSLLAVLRQLIVPAR